MHHGFTELLGRWGLDGELTLCCSLPCFPSFHLSVWRHRPAFGVADRNVAVASLVAAAALGRCRWYRHGSLPEDTLWQFGLVGGVRNNTADPPTALMETSLLDVASNTYKTINCRGGCAIMAGGTIKFDGDDSTAGGAPIATYKLNYGDGTGSVRGTATTFYKKYAAVGVFKPALIVADTNGLTDQDVVSIN
ncbi:unnamed protein product, partial [Phaeothamnion confervicola]